MAARFLIFITIVFTVGPAWAFEPKKDPTRQELGIYRAEVAHFKQKEMDRIEQLLENRGVVKEEVKQESPVGESGSQ